MASDAPSAWAPIVLLVLMALGFAVANIVISTHIGPSRTGAVKSSTYESGVVPIGTARGRFNVRFYMVAVIFLVFDVDIILFYPWATIYPVILQSDRSGAVGSMLLLDIVVFIALLLLAYIYAWGKGVFRWD
jgi:NADH-quinone oxidoreductase subunit A